LQNIAVGDTFRSMLRPVFALLFTVAISAGQESPEAAFLANTRQLIFEGKRSGEGYFSPDGKKLVFQSEREEGNPFYQIYTLDLDSGDTARVSSGVGKTTCAFFQPGKDRILYASTHHDPAAKEKMQAEIDFRASGKQRRYAWDYDETMDIFSSTLDGKDVTQLTKARGYDAEGSFSPNGQEIVFCSTRSGYEDGATADAKARLAKDPAYFGEIYRMRADGSDVVRLTTAPGYDGGPFFSPSGARICWRRFDESGMNADVFTMDRAGGSVTRVTEFGCMSWAPYYHPSERYLIFTANKLGFENFELFIVDSEGRKEPVRVTFTNGFDGLPVFSPDGSKLCWTTNRTADGKSQLFLANWNHAAALAALDKAPPRSAAAAVKREGSAAAPGSPAKAEAGPSSSAAAGFTPEITEADLRAQVSFLADEKLEGRATGTDGTKLASEWLAESLKASGVQPLPGVGSYFLPFDFNAGARVIPGHNHLSVTSGAETGWKVDADFRPLAFSENAAVEGDVVFAGYGLSVPEAPNQPRYNSYEGLDVKDKVVVVLRYVPEQVDAPRRAT
jgi:Tol biopolymer transport system component